MGWQDLIQQPDELVGLPWTGGRTLCSLTRSWTIEGTLPKEFGWYSFEVNNRSARFLRSCEPVRELLRFEVRGYLVGDHVVPDGVAIDPDPIKITRFSERAFLLDDGFDRFNRVVAGRIYKEGPLICKHQDFPLGPESEVLQAYLDHKDSVSDIKGVSPALDAAFRMERYQRIEAAKRRVELERLRREEEEKRQKEQRRAELVKQLGDGAGRRKMARVDFDSAARAALAVGGAEFLDAKRVRAGEWAVKYRLDGARYEVICDEKLQIIDSGICLTSHDTGEKGDTYFTLESIPAVVREAIKTNKLVVYRHV